MGRSPANQVNEPEARLGLPDRRQMSDYLACGL